MWKATTPAYWPRCPYLEIDAGSWKARPFSGK
jgi:hypothetical protein